MHDLTAVYNNFNVLLHKNIFHITKTLSWITKSPYTTERRRLRTIQEICSTEYSTIQKVSVQCIEGTNDISGLLSSFWCRHSCISYYWTSYPILKYIHLLLENQGSKTGRERYHLPVILLLKVNVSKFLEKRTKHRNLSFIFVITILLNLNLIIHFFGQYQVFPISFLTVFKAGVITFEKHIGLFFRLLKKQNTKRKKKKYWKF